MRFGLVGYGFGGRYFHAPLLASAPGVDFAGVVTRSPQRRAELAAEWPAATAYDSLAALAGDGVEAVAISTPADTHIPLALEAIALGLAVVVDKPFALGAAEARTAVDAARKAGVPLSVYQNRRWDSDLLTVRKLIADGSLGRVTRFESRFERFAPELGPPAAGGGTLRDFGAHLVDQALYLFGPAAHVYARLSDRDDDFFLSIGHTGGVESQLWGSYVQGAPGPRFRVAGTTGAYVVGGVGAALGGIDGQEEALIAGRTPATEGDAWGTEPAERWGRLYRGTEFETVPTERGRWDTFYPAFAAAVRGEAPLPVDPEDVVRNVELLDVARQSAATGETVKL
jgi:predicted dehydrogenase